MNESFKERVRKAAIDNAALYKSTLVDYEYCIFSSGLSTKYVIIKALESNYLHLVGVSTNLTADAFFKKCINQTLTEEDFDFLKRGVASGVLKGAVREKIRVLDKMIGLLHSPDLQIQENFEHNKIQCAFASASNDCTLGYAVSGYPKSLLRGNYLDDKSLDVDLIVRRPNGSDAPFSEIVRGSVDNTKLYSDVTSTLLSAELLKDKNEEET